jgi:hypothetical protein
MLLQDLCEKGPEVEGDGLVPELVALLQPHHPTQGCAPWRPRVALHQLPHRRLDAICTVVRSVMMMMIMTLVCLAMVVRVMMISDGGGDDDHILVTTRRDVLPAGPGSRSISSRTMDLTPSVQW